MTANFTSASPSIDKAIAANANYGSFNRLIFDMINGTTSAATTTCGFVTAQRFPTRPTIPSVGAGVQGYIATNIQAFTEDSNTIMIVGLEYLLGTVLFAANTFTAGVSMPLKTVKGASGIQTASGLTMMVVRTGLTATNPVITTTYTDQAGTTGRTCSLTIPTNATANSAFLMQPHMTSSSNGVRSVQSISRSTGSIGVIDVYGILPLYISHRNVALYNTNILNNFSIPWLIAPGERLGFYRLLSNTTCDACISITLVPEPS